MLYVKGDYYLSEYLSNVQNALELTSVSSSQPFMSTPANPATNLFENYPACDLTYLRGHAAIIPQTEIKSLGTRAQDHIIRLLHPHYS